MTGATPQRRQTVRARTGARTIPGPHFLQLLTVFRPAHFPLADPSWCLALVIGLTLISLLSHAAPSHWIPAPGLPLRKSSSVLADASNADPLPSPHKWVAPSPLPQKGVMDEVRVRTLSARVRTVLALLKSEREILTQPSTRALRRLRFSTPCTATAGA